MMLIPADLDPRSPIPMSWRERSACLDESPELFFPIGSSVHAQIQIQKAKDICRHCKVVHTCLQWAVRSGQDAGVWGGLTDHERHAITAAVPAPD